MARSQIREEFENDIALGGFKNERVFRVFVSHRASPIERIPKSLNHFLGQGYVLNLERIPKSVKQFSDKMRVKTDI
ncbi:hypothetical protein Brsp01_05670 [Brucella sp. NBRC 12950]|nr:hypothetical protein Brsp01_05670 [Brucella sp. NBRC 12950]